MTGFSLARSVSQSSTQEAGTVSTLTVVCTGATPEEGDVAGPSTVFVFNRIPPIAPSTDPTDVFVNIASPADLEELGTSLGNATFGYFLADTVIFNFRSIQEMEDCWSLVVQDVTLLASQLTKLAAGTFSSDTAVIRA